MLFNCNTQNLNCKTYLTWNTEYLYVNTTASNVLSFFSVPAEPLLCKFADGGQKKRQNQNKYIQNGRAWHREGEVRLVSPPFKL